MTDDLERKNLKAAAWKAATIPSIAKAAGITNSVELAQAETEEWLKRTFASKPAPGMSVAIAGVTGLIWAGAIGLTNLELAVPAQIQHSFPLGSISKIVTSTLAARLATRGELDLDAPIGAVMPDLPAQHRNTTLRQLLTHRGGIRHYAPSEAEMGHPNLPVYMRTYPSDDDVLSLFINDPLLSPPGSEVIYSSYGYTLASIAIAAATGRAFLTLVDEEIAKPFALRSLAPDDPLRIVPNRAARYMNDLDLKALCAGLNDNARPPIREGWAKLPFHNPAYCWAGAGFLMTPSDTASFGAAMIASPFSKIGAEERALLFSPTTTASTKDNPPLGLGWRIDADKSGRRRWHHAGATPGGCHVLTVYPDQGLSVAIASNIMTMKTNLLQGASDLIDIWAKSPQ